MKILQRFAYLIITIFFLIAGTGLSSCNSRKSICESNRVYQSKKIKKNKSQYNTRYSYKGKPVRKDYVLRNGR